MRTFVLLGMAAGSLLLASHTRAEQPALDYGVPADPDTRVYTGYPDRVPSEVDYRYVNGTYDAEGRRYEGRYEGTIEGHGAGYPPPPVYDPRYHGGYGYDARYDEEMERRCGRGGTVGGAVVGGLVGGIAGNRIAGRGDRTAGTLIGGGLGALAGSAIGSAADKKKCDEWWLSRSARYQGGHYQGGYYPGGTYPGGYATTYQYGGYGYGYGYYTPGVVVTTIITNGAPVVTERVETSTRTYYENVPVRKRYVAKKKWKPRPKPRCVC